MQAEADLASLATRINHSHPRRIRIACPLIHKVENERSDPARSMLGAASGEHRDQPAIGFHPTISPQTSCSMAASDARVMSLHPLRAAAIGMHAIDATYIVVISKAC